jgi:hypothetical protein
MLWGRREIYSVSERLGLWDASIERCTVQQSIEASGMTRNDASLLSTAEIVEYHFPITFSRQPILPYFSAFQSLAALPEYVIILILPVLAKLTVNNTTQYNTVQCSTVQCCTIQCSTVRYTDLRQREKRSDMKN